MAALVDAIGTSAAPRRRWVLPAATVTVAAIMAAGLTVLMTREPRLASDAANGRYRSDCCGTIVLRDGEMIANERRWARYRVEVDESGPFVLPDRWVGAFDQGIVLDGSRPVEKIRLDRLPRPTRMLVPGTRGPNLFVRQEPRRVLVGG